jgi:class 3 adenylate cyclase/TolB-like protein
MERRLAAIVATDVVGYSRLMGMDEAATLAALKTHREELIDPKIAAHNGRIVKLMGDGALVEFASVVDAVRCAVEIQQRMEERNRDVPEDRRIVLRIGINLGDIIVEGDDIFGDGVNVAARLETLADPGGICVSRSVRDQIRDKIRIPLDDLGQIEVKNIARPIRAFRMLGEAGAPASAAKRREIKMRPGYLVTAMATVAVIVAAALVVQLIALSPEVPDVGPSIAVLPFDNISGDPEQAYFSDGMTADLITDLSHVSGWSVIAYATMKDFKGRGIKDVSAELGVSHVVTGRVRKVDDRIRINVELIDAGTSLQPWGERYDRRITDVLALQDEVVKRIVSALAVELTPDEQERLENADEVDPEAYDLLLRGLAEYRRFTRVTNAAARDYFEQALAYNPDYARAYAGLALTYGMDASLGWVDEPEDALNKGLSMAQRALGLSDEIPEVYFALAVVYRNQKRHAEGIAASRRSIDIDPNYADGYAQLAINLNFAGQPEEGLQAILKAMELNPRSPFFYVWLEGQSHYLLGQFDEAAELFERVAQSNPEFPAAHKMLAATYIELGRTDDAEWAAEELQALNPDFSLERERLATPYKDKAVLERYIKRLYASGLPN